MIKAPDNVEFHRAMMRLNGSSDFQYFIKHLKSEEQRLFRVSRKAQGRLLFWCQGSLQALDAVFNMTDRDVLKDKM